MICPTCKGSGKQVVRTRTVLDGVREVSDVKIECQTCQGSGEVDKAEYEARQKAIRDFWCRCGNPSEDVEYYEYADGAHGWTCRDCGKVVQVG